MSKPSRASRSVPPRMPARRMLRSNPAVKRLKKKVDVLAMGQERKFYDTFLTGGSVAPSTNWTGCEFDPSTTSMISTPAVGDTASDRDGKKIAVYSVLVNGTIQYPARSNDTVEPLYGPTFVALVLDKQTNGVQLNAEDVYSNPSGGANLPASPVRNQNFRKRFKVLRSKVIASPVLSTSYDGTNLETQGKLIPFKFFVRFRKPLVINFNSGTTASVANVLDKSIHIIANSASTTQTIAYNAEMVFVG